MNTSVRNPTGFVFFGVFAIAMSGLARAEIPAADGTIDGCYGKTVLNLGVLRVIDAEKGQTCRSFEKPLSWQQEAPAPIQASLTLQAEEEAISGLPAFASRATITVNAPAAGSVLVNAWTTITPGGLQGSAFSRLRDTATNEVSTIQATTYQTYPSPISVGWVFEVPAGEHTFSLDIALSANIIQFTNETMTALFVPKTAEN